MAAFGMPKTDCWGTWKLKELITCLKELIRTTQISVRALINRSSWPIRSSWPYFMLVGNYPGLIDFGFKYAIV